MRRLIILALLLCNCAGSRAKLQCPARPVLKPVEVKRGTITGESTKNVIDNHINSWDYIHKLEALGDCK